MTSCPAVVWYCDEIGIVNANRCELPDWQRQRLAAMTHGGARQQRAVAWWLANQLLAERLRRSPCQSLWRHDAAGRPVVPGTGLRLSISHCSDGVAVACAPAPVGVDIESRERCRDWRSLARRVFAPSERAVLASLPEQQRSMAALQLWSAREAWGKAGGRGIAALARRPLFQWQDGAWQALQGGIWQTCRARLQLSLALPQAAAGVPPALFRLRPSPGGQGMVRLSHEADTWRPERNED